MRFGDLALTGLALNNPTVLEIAPLLLAKNINKTNQDKVGSSLLHIRGKGRVRPHTESVLALLLEYGISPNTQDALGYTPLYWASANHKSGLVYYGANPFIKTSLVGKSALGLARSREPQALNTTLEDQQQVIAMLEKALIKGKQGVMLFVLKTKATVVQPDANLINSFLKATALQGWFGGCFAAFCNSQQDLFIVRIFIIFLLQNA
ncbi:ankyrin repeat domain-containing protein [Candidatus Dependentiae bacterium]|nr:ankyrin repeat domain-containing protein [Candidatus Dependentiae bacterium]